MAKSRNGDHIFITRALRSRKVLGAFHKMFLTRYRMAQLNSIKGKKATLSKIANKSPRLK